MTEHGPMIRVDGNAVAGMLAGVVAGDPTTLPLRCGWCGDRFLLAETVVEREPASALVRCRSCTHTLFTLSEEADGLVLRTAVFDIRFPLP